ncbi:MAG: YifB family Mg chelatase-like AAA ATPase [Bacillota bacterium]
MLSRIKTFGLFGIEGYEITVEVNVALGMPAFNLVGLPDSSVKESKERVKTAIENSGFRSKYQKVTVNLSPADKKKEGTFFDLPIAVGILCSTGYVKADAETIFVGELSLDGSINGVRGILPIIISAKQHGYKKFIIPDDNVNEASYIEGIDVYAVKTLKGLVAHLNGDAVIEKAVQREFLQVVSQNEFSHDMSQVKGQAVAKRAMEIAVSGGHNLLFVGAPGMGKTMLAKCLPSIMPTMRADEALEITKIHSISGTLDSKVGIVTTRPFRTPHHTATTPALCGGGTNALPGEISLATHGVLFLDELPEYNRQTIESLRQPLEDRVISVARANQKAMYPANFMLVASMNPCPCGNFGSSKPCRCTQSQIAKYLAKLSGPLLDRIDIQVEVDSIEYDEILKSETSESSSDVKARVEKAREIQLERYVGTKEKTNSEISDKEMSKFCKLSDDCEAILKMAFESLNLSMRGRTRIIRVARTIADLDGSTEIQAHHIAEAIQYRTLDRKYFVKGVGN